MNSVVRYPCAICGKAIVIDENGCCVDCLIYLGQ
jgi:hypothetical protein